MKTLLVVLGLMAVTAAAQQLGKEYASLARPPLAQTAAMENTSLAWGTLRFSFARGEMELAAPIPAGGPGAGRVTAAVFRGAGTLTVALPNTPRAAIERQQIRLLRGTDGIAESFTEAVFRFADGDAWMAALGGQANFRPIVGTAPLGDLVEQRAKENDQRGALEVARLLQALSGAAAGAGPHLLFADLRLSDGKWIQAVYDPWRQEPVEVHRWAQNPAAGLQVFDDIWTQFAPAGAAPATGIYHLDQYQMQLAIPDNLDLSAGVGFSLTALAGVGRGVLLRLDSNLRVTAASTATGGEVDYLQPLDPGRDPNPWFQGDWLYLQLPQPLAAGQSVTIELRYHGKQIIQKVGNGNFFCRSEGWYPQNLFGSPLQRARYDLTFQVNPSYTVVATGVRDRNARLGPFQVTHWTSPVPLTVAGFALGSYQEIEQPVTLSDGQKVVVRVYSNLDPDDMLASINLANRSDLSVPMGTLDTKRLAPEALAQTGNALRFLSAYFGPYPYAGLSVTPIPGDYGQGWPTLLYLSTLSFLDSTQLHALGLPEAAMDQLSYTFRAHEVSHQWWGHRISWATARDQWLSEGFANASALLFEERTAGVGQALDTLAAWRRDLLTKDRFGHIPEQDGALWLGTRLSSTADPLGYEIVTYDKGGYVLYMLRQMMLDSASKTPDAAFIAMMRDFTATYANRDASTADFQAIAEKHMTRAMDLDGDHKLDWFFNQYVYGTGVPRLQFHSAVAAAGDGKYRVTLTVDNPDRWRGLLPVYIFSDDKHFSRGELRVDQPHQVVEVPSAFAPRKIVANDLQDMLVEVKQ